MCGIAGILNFNTDPIPVEIMSDMLVRLAHRGRDFSQALGGSAHSGRPQIISSSAEIALGHRRLSIIDLSDQASQPMSYGNNSLWITFNGEIFNYLELREALSLKGHEFKTRSDTEVILAAYREWGDRCVEHFNGMFAFAIWDESSRRLFCARDQLGIKPFYYHLDGNAFAFASESRALRHFHGNHFSAEALSTYLLGMYVPGSWSLFAGVRKLLPGHTMVVYPSGKVEQKRYWAVRKFADIQDCPATRADLENLLKRAVELQLRSDVPVGALLSGGVDSGMIVALAARAGAKLHTYSIGFDGKEDCELSAAAQIAERYGTTHHQRKISSVEAMQYLDRSLKCLAEPIADPALVPSFVLAEMAAGDGVKVLLSGTGGDEIFGGYDRYVGKGLPRKAFSLIPEKMRRAMGMFLPNGKLKSRLDNPYLDMQFTTGGSYELFLSMSGDAGCSSRTLKRMNSDAFQMPDYTSAPLVYRQMAFDAHVYMPDEILLLLDQMTMAHTIEGRVPLIDVDVVNMAYRFQVKSHVFAGKTKKLFRDVAEGYLGRKHVWRKKQGFAGPVPIWISENYSLFSDAAMSIVDIPGMERVNAAKLGLLNLDKAQPDPVKSHALFVLYCLRKWVDSLN